MREGLSTLTTLFLMITLAGGAAFYTGVIQVPEVSLADEGSWGDVTGDHVEIVTTIDVNNPNDFAIDLQPIGVTYSIYMNDVLMAQGSQQGGRIPPGDSSIDITTALIQANITDWWVSHMENDEETAVTAATAVEIDTPHFSHEFDGIEYTHDIDTEISPMMADALAGMEGNYGYDATGIDLVDPEVEIRDTHVDWGAITADHTELQLTLDVHNPNAYPIPVPDFVGQLVMNDVVVADWDADDVHVVDAPGDSLIASGATETITLGINLHHDAITEWLTAHIEQDEHTTGYMQARMGFTIQDQQLYIPPRGSLHCDFQFWTGILEDQVERMEDQGCSVRDAGLVNDTDENVLSSDNGGIMDRIDDLIASVQ